MSDIQNTWKVTNLDCYPTYSGLKDYVFTVHWDCLAYYSGISGGPFNGRVYSTCSFTPEISGEFTPYENLTENTVLNWVWDTMGQNQKNAYESGVNTQIYNQITPPVVSPPLPWTTPITGMFA